MPPSPASTSRGPLALQKARTGIAGLDYVTHGGLPAGRPTLVCGAAGSGKSLFGVEFLVRGATEFGEPGVLMTFDERPEDITTNVASLGFDLATLVRKKRLAIDHVEINRHDFEENGEYDLEGLFIRLDHAVRSVGAKRVVLDTLESLFSGFPNEAILRSELRRLFLWLKDRRLTTVLTGERGQGQLTRHGLEEYVSDCVILLDHRVANQVSTRRLRVVKYRGSTHGTNEYPFLVDDRGISVLPITQASLDYSVSQERLSSGIPALDEMLGGKGFYRGGTILLTGTPGTGKTSIAAHFANAACERGERCLFFSFEESPAQILRNMRSIGVNLQRHVRSERLKLRSTLPTAEGIEMHLVHMHRLIEEFRPAAIVVDPISNLEKAGETSGATELLIRLLDVLRSRRITSFLVSLSNGGLPEDSTRGGVSSAVDTWLLTRSVEVGTERRRSIHVLKSRGMPHSNQIREFVITSKGIQLLSTSGSLNGDAGSSQFPPPFHRRSEPHGVSAETERRVRILEHNRKALEAQVAALQEAIALQTDDHHGRLQPSLSQPATAALSSGSGSRNRTAPKDAQLTRKP